MNAIMIVMNEFINRADCECENCIGVICAPENRWKSYLEPTGHNLWIDADIDIEEVSDDESEDDDSVCRCGKQIPEDTGKCCGCCEDCCCCFDSEDDAEERDTREDDPQDEDDEDEFFVYDGPIF